MDTPTLTSSALLASLRHEIAAHGWDRKATVRIVAELLLHLSLALAGMALFLRSDDWLVRVRALVLATAGMIGVGTNTNTSSHYGMFAALAPGHFPTDAARLSAGQKNADHLLMQTANTINFRTGWIGRLLVSGLDHQIEHHLFPNLSHVHYRKLEPLVERMCREQGWPYRAFGWDHVLWKCWMSFRRPRPIVTDAETLRVRPQTGLTTGPTTGAAANL